MISIPFDDSDVQAASRLACDLGALHNSILSGGGNAAGYLAEITIARYLGAEVVSSDLGTLKYDRDIVLPDGRTAELKTKRRTVDPRMRYDASVADTSGHQMAELLIFASITFAEVSAAHPRVYTGPRRIWACGWIEARDYRRQARQWHRGERDSENGFVAHADMRNLPYSELFSVAALSRLRA